MTPIKALETLDVALIILRAKIIALTGLEQDFVLDALSAYGTDLAKVLSEAQESIKQKALNPTETVNDTLILLEARNDIDSSDNMFEKQNAYGAYILHVTIYGESAEEISMKLKAKILLIDEKVDLNMKGVQIRSISNIESVNEYKNEVMWQRRDMDIHFAFRRIYT